jgi:Glycosyl transferase family 2
MPRSDDSAYRQVDRVCRWLGFDHVFLWDNNSVDGEQQRSVLSRAFPRSFLSLYSEREPQGQLKVYAWCAEEQRASYNWVAFFDLDEFLVLRDRCSL